jgi:hypothetical protein
MKAKMNNNAFYGNPEHRGGTKRAQPGVEFSHKIQEDRKDATRGYRGKMG